MRILHLSDFHFGHHDAGIAAGLAADINTLSPRLVVVSGDFTQIGSRTEFHAARAFLEQIESPVFAVPGNHDVPALDLMRRFVDPYGHYRRYIDEDLEPFLELDNVALAGLKTSRRMRLGLNWAEGAISAPQLDRLRQRFASAAPDALRIVVAHHPLLQPSGEMARPMRAVKRADLALSTFASLGVRLVLSGHFHMTYVRRHEGSSPVAVDAPVGARQAAAGPILVAQASSTISTRLRGDVNSYNVIDIAGGIISIAVREWRQGGWMTREETLEPA